MVKTKLEIRHKRNNTDVFMICVDSSLPTRLEKKVEKRKDLLFNVLKK